MTANRIEGDHQGYHFIVTWAQEMNGCKVTMTATLGDEDPHHAEFFDEANSDANSFAEFARKWINRDSSGWQKTGANMDMLSMQANILAQDAFLKALALTRKDQDKLQVKFNEIWTEVVRDLNKSGQAELAKKLHEAAGALSHYAR